MLNYCLISKGLILSYTIEAYRQIWDTIEDVGCKTRCTSYNMHHIVSKSATNHNDQNLNLIDRIILILESIYGEEF